MMGCSMKKYFGCIYFLFYILSIAVLEIFLDKNTFFNYAIFMGSVVLLEIVSLLISYVVYKVSNYYKLQKDYTNRNKSIFLILSRIIGLSVIGFFLVFILSQYISNWMVGSDLLVLTIRLSSLMFLMLPLIGVFRGMLYTFGYKNVIYSSYLGCSFIHFILVILVTLICFIIKLDATYVLILSVAFSYLVLYLYLFFLSTKNIKYTNDKNNYVTFMENRCSLCSRINVYSFVFIFILPILFMFSDVLYGKMLLDMGTLLNDVKNFEIVTTFIGPVLNIIFIFSFLSFYGYTTINKDNLLSTIIGLLRISLPVIILVSMFYNYYVVYKYFIYLVPLQISCLIVLIFLYNQNSRGIVLKTICLMFVAKFFFNIIFLNSFRYTGILNYNSLITSSIVTYLLLFVILIIYSVIKFKLSGEVFVKALVDTIVNLVFTVSILLILKSCFYYDNIFFTIMYVVFGMCLYAFIQKIIKHF